MMIRRRFCAILPAALTIGGARSQSRDFDEEVQFGDPSLPPERVQVPIRKHQFLLDLGKSQGLEKDAKSFAAQLLVIAADYVGKSEWNQPQVVEDFFDLFEFPPKNSAGAFQPFCAAGLSFVACHAYCALDPERMFNQNDRLFVFRDTLPDIQKFYFKPEISVIRMRDDAVTREKWLRPEDLRPNLPLPGWLVVFDWNRDGVPDHVGLVESANKELVHTIEFNTRTDDGTDQGRGGYIVRKTREWTAIQGFIAVYTEKP